MLFAAALGFLGICEAQPPREAGEWILFFAWQPLPGGKAQDGHEALSLPNWMGPRWKRHRERIRS